VLAEDAAMMVGEKVRRERMDRVMSLVILSMEELKKSVM
jgi:hypothetical protein